MPSSIAPRPAIALSVMLLLSGCVGGLIGSPAGTETDTSTPTATAVPTPQTVAGVCDLRNVPHGPAPDAPAYPDYAGDLDRESAKRYAKQFARARAWYEMRYPEVRRISVWISSRGLRDTGDGTVVELKARMSSLSEDEVIVDHEWYVKYYLTDDTVRRQRSVEESDLGPPENWPVVCG